MNNVKKIALKDILRDHDTQMRVEIDPEVVARYAADMEGGDQFPPVKLCQEGRRFYIIDGWERIGAAESIGWEKIDAEVVTGKKRDAVLLACAANATHGQHRSPEDIKVLLNRMFADDEWGCWSDREIAAHTKLSHTTVARYRGTYETENAQLAQVANSEPAKRKGKDGKLREVKPRVLKQQDDTSFDVEEIEEQPETAKRNGKPLASSSDRDEARRSLSSLIKSLNRLGIYDEYIVPLSDIAERLKQI